MKPLLPALAATLLLGASGALASDAPYRVRYAPPPPPPGAYLTPDEVRDYREDQLDRRQEMEREALRMRQKAERRAWGFDDD